MGCEPCNQRKANLAAMAAEGNPLPARDYWFYIAVVVAVVAVGYIAWTRWQR